MIDLRKKTLPNTVTVSGRTFSVYTDYRLWMRFEYEVSRMHGAERIDVSYLFINDHPGYCSIPDLFQFSRPSKELPRRIGRESRATALDYVLDADYIYAAFMEKYGIDLIEEDMHWHKFLALLNGITVSLKEIIEYRCYEKAADKNADIYEMLKHAWEILPPESEEEMQETEAFSSMFK